MDLFIIIPSNQPFLQELLHNIRALNRKYLSRSSIEFDISGNILVVTTKVYSVNVITFPSWFKQMGSLLAVHNLPGNGPTRTPLQNILETSSLVHHKNPVGEGPVVCSLERIFDFKIGKKLKILIVINFMGYILKLTLFTDLLD